MEITDTNNLNLSDREMVAEQRREAADLRAGKSEAWKATIFTAEELADMCDAYADAIEAGEFIDGELIEEEQTPEEREAELEARDQLIDLLERHGADSLVELNERYSNK
jgi:hypothetical protein